MKRSQNYLHLIILLSLTATSPAVAKLTKTWCKDTCGNNVTIPYPFGISAKCALNEWYTVECNNSTPYLPEVNHLEVLDVDLKDQTVNVRIPRISRCQNPVGNNTEFTGVNLGKNPFLISKKNTFFFEGCGTAALMMDDGSVVTGCSTVCLDITSNFAFSDTNCFGKGCCQTTIPHYLKSYNIKFIMGLERQGVDGSCGSAFLVDTSYSDEEESFSDLSFRVSLLWTLTDSDQITCCGKDNPTRLKVDMFNGIPEDSLKCKITLGRWLLENYNPYLEDGCTRYGIVGTPKYPEKVCNDKCGNIRIPYPFGMGVNCAVSQWYIIDCNNETPYLSAFNHLEVTGVSLENQTVTVSTPRITNCKNPVQNSSEIMGVDLGGSPFLFDRFHNKFVFKGCGNATMIMDNGSVLTGCTTACADDTLQDENCFGISDCCKTTIPAYFKSYSINLSSMEEEDGGCGSAFLVDETLFVEGRFSDRNTTFVPVSFRWTLRESDNLTCCQDLPLYTDRSDSLNMFNGTTIDTMVCYTPSSSSSIEGNPYLRDGCKYNEYDEEPECRKCRDSGGYCTSNDGIENIDGSVFNQTFTCIQTHPQQMDDKRASMGVILGVSISTGVVFLVGASYLLYKWIKKLKEKRQRKRFFKRNGG